MKKFIVYFVKKQLIKIIKYVNVKKQFYQKIFAQIIIKNLFSIIKIIF